MIDESRGFTGNGDLQQPRHSEIPLAIFEPNRVLVVGKSQINRIVVCRIVERGGFKSRSEPPEEADAVLRRSIPGTVILDGGPNNSDCDELLASLQSLRAQSPEGYPRVILLSNRVVYEDDRLAAHPTIDAVVAKPITPELLQPVVDRLNGRQ